jgi:hypothetical protein
MRFCRGNCEAARTLLRAPWYRPHRLSRSRFNRRVHHLNEFLVTLFARLGHTWKPLTPESVDILDRFPIAVCDHSRMPRAKFYRHEGYRGYIASKKRDVYGLTRHRLVAKDGQPIACDLTPGSSSDVRVRQTFPLDLPAGSPIDAEKGDHDDDLEDALREAVDMQ